MDHTLASISDDLVKKYRSFKLCNAKGSSAIISKIDPKSRQFEIEQEIKDLCIDDLPNEIALNEPRFILISYELHHDDGRVSYPYCLIFSSPRVSPPDLKMMYAGSLHHFIDSSQVTKVLELHDVEDLSEEWLRAEMKKKGF
uniref:ADF-H domain-containing protein n=1 Tax=Mesocestoides corti TaxID=53468 RepID=A0A5K3FTK7_MESCO